MNEKTSQRSKESVIVASACLLGVRCRYDGGHRLDDKVFAISEKEKLIPLCPEQLGGLPVPRPPAEIVGGDEMMSWTAWQGLSMKKAKILQRSS